FSGISARRELEEDSALTASRLLSIEGLEEIATLRTIVVEEHRGPASPSEVLGALKMRKKGQLLIQPPRGLEENLTRVPEDSPRKVQPGRLSDGEGEGQCPPSGNPRRLN
ncbi:MAG TPA: hypothetical protein VMT52_05660, partial [Planctomycetota bacterium]|nr:hypothetical protein [Planctomycetota bacterium]